MSRGGRDQLRPIERLVRILAVLEGAGPAGATQEQLLAVANYGASNPDNQRRMLNKDVTYLNESGWDIQNVADTGMKARYLLHARDIRLRVELNAAEQAELARVGRMAGVDEFADYVGTDAGPPEPEPDVQRGTLDPATWEIDPPVDVEVETTLAFVDQVKLALRSVVDERVEGDRIVLTLRVTNRSAFRVRVYALGTRVRVLRPDDVRNELIDELARLAGST